MNRIRIATIFPRLHIGGDQNRMINYVRAMDRERFDHRFVLLVAPTADRDEAEGPMLQHVLDQGARVEIIGVTPRSAWADQPFFVSAVRDAAAFFGTTLRLARYFREQRIDVVDTRVQHTIQISAAAARLAGVPAIVSTEYLTSMYDSALGRLMRHSLFFLVDAMVTDSRARANDFRALISRSEGKIHVIPNGIAPPCSSCGREAARARLGLPTGPGVRVLAQISRIHPIKGHPVLLEAAAPVMAEKPDLHLLICGYPSEHVRYLAELQKQAADLGISERVRISGYPGPIGDVWAAVDIHVHAALVDSSPIAIYESMSLGLPLVATTTGGIPELVEDGKSGLLVPPGDSRALAEAIRRLLGDPGLAARLGAAAQQRYRAFYRPETMARSLEDLFRRILETKRRETPIRPPGVPVPKAKSNR